MGLFTGRRKGRKNGPTVPVNRHKCWHNRCRKEILLLNPRSVCVCKLPPSTRLWGQMARNWPLTALGRNTGVKTNALGGIEGIDANAMGIVLHLPHWHAIAIDCNWKFACFYLSLPLPETVCLLINLMQISFLIKRWPREAVRPSVRPYRPVRQKCQVKRSSVFSHFKISDRFKKCRGKCKHCSSELNFLSNVTSNLMKHLS